MPEVLNDHKVLNEQQVANQQQKIADKEESSSSLGVLYKNEAINQPDENLGEIGGRLKIGRERPKQYHSLASKVYSVVQKMNVDPTYAFRPEDPKSMEEKQLLLEAIEAVPDLIADEDTILQENLATITTEDPDERKEEEGKMRLESRQRKQKHVALQKYIESIFRHNDERLNGKKGLSVPTITDAKKDVQDKVEEKPEDITFDIASFENELIAGGLAELSTLKGKTKLFTENTIVLADTYHPTDKLATADSTPAWTRQLNAELGEIDADIQLVDTLVSKLTDKATMFTFTSGPGGADKKAYISDVLLQKLSKLRTELVNRKEIFQKKKDEITPIDIKALPQVRKLQSLLAQTPDTSKKFTTIAEYIAHRNTINSAISKVSSDAIRAELQTVKKLSPEEADRYVQKIQTEVIDPANVELQKFEATIFDFWKSTHLENASLAPEMVLLKKLIQDGNKGTGGKVVDDVNLLNQIGLARQSLIDKKDEYIDALPSSADIRAKADAEIMRWVQEATQVQDRLLEDAKRKVPGEVHSVPEIKALIDAINAPIDPVTIDTQEQTLRTAFGIADEAKQTEIRNTFDRQLHTTIDVVFADLFGKDGKVEMKLKAFEDKRGKIASDDAEVVRTRRRKVITDILELAAVPETDPNSFWFKDPAELVQLQQDLANEIAEASKPGGVPMQATEYEDARRNISEFVDTRKEYNEERMEKIWSEMRTNFRTPVDNTSDPVHHLYEIAKKLDSIFHTDHEKRYRVLEGMWKAFKSSAGENVTSDVGRNLIWADANKGRTVVTGYNDEINSFQGYKEVVDKDGNTLQDMVHFIDDLFDQGDREYNGVRHNYGREGNPDIGKVERGCPTVEDQLRLRFPTAHDSVIKSIAYDNIVVTEQRYPYIQKYYETYEQSPVGVQDFTPIITSSHMSVTLYNILKGQNVPKGLRSFWRLTTIASDRRVPSQDVSPHHKYNGPHEKVRVPAPDEKKVKMTRVTEAREAAIRANEYATTLDIYAPQASTYKEIYDHSGNLLDKDYVQLHSTELADDLIDFPYFSHVVRGDYPGTMTASEYFKSAEAHDKFLRDADVENQLPQIGSVDDVGANIRKLTGGVSTFKGIYDVMKKKTSEVPADKLADLLAKNPPQVREEGEYLVHEHWDKSVSLIRNTILNYIQAEWRAFYPQVKSGDLVVRLRTGELFTGAKEVFIDQIKRNLSNDLPDPIYYWVLQAIEDVMLPSGLDLVKDIKDKTRTGGIMAGATALFRATIGTEKPEWNPQAALFSEYTGASKEFFLTKDYLGKAENLNHRQYMVTSNVTSGVKADDKH